MLNLNGRKYSSIDFCKLALNIFKHTKELSLFLKTVSYE
jgi:hypothetical protein